MKKSAARHCSFALTGLSPLPAHNSPKRAAAARKRPEISLCGCAQLFSTNSGPAGGPSPAAHASFSQEKLFYTGTGMYSRITETRTSYKNPRGSGGGQRTLSQRSYCSVSLCSVPQNPKTPRGSGDLCGSCLSAPTVSRAARHRALARARAAELRRR